MFSELDVAISNWNNAGRIAVILDNATGRNGYLLQHFISTAINAERKILLIGLEQTLGHYHSVSMKLGLNLLKLKESGGLIFYDGLRSLLKSSIQETLGSENLVTQKTSKSGANNGLSPLLKYIESVIGGGGDKWSVIIDNLSILIYLGWTERELVQFCCGLSQLSNSCQQLVIRAGESDVLSEDEEGSGPLLVGNLRRISSLCLSTTQLQTGRSRTVTGNLLIQKRSGPEGDMLGSRYHYRVEEKTVRIFPPGTSSGLL